ncbi:MAG TPA: malate synthase A, partial [Oscillatoriaceae cyanobacterium]
LAARRERAAAIAGGERPGFLPETVSIRESEWRVPEPPRDLLDRRVEITGPAERKMMINALNSGARVFMADLEDSLSPGWRNVIAAQTNLQDAARRTLSLETEGKRYALHDETATLLVRPRGWHLVEAHLTLDGAPVSASLFDFGLAFFHNAAALLARGSGPYYYLPKLESHREAALWNDVFVHAQEALGLPRGTIRATVLIETVLAAFEMDEILHALGPHAAGLNAGRWDYLFSAIKKFHAWPSFRLPDRAQLTMGVPFMRAYTELLVKTCHRRGAMAIGGMSAFVPSRKDAEVNARAFEKVREDKDRESGAGFDGTWVAHPDLVPLAKGVFDAVLGDSPNQLHRQRPDVHVSADQLLDFQVPGGAVTEAGLADNIEVTLHYLASWLSGNGAVAIHHLMEDAATAEIARSQIWHWLHTGAKLASGATVTPELYASLRDRALAKLEGLPRLAQARKLLDRLSLSDTYEEFLTVPAYEALLSESEV